MARHEPNRKSLAVALLAAFVAVTLLVGALAMLFGGQVRQKAQELAQESPAPTSSEPSGALEDELATASQPGAEPFVTAGKRVRKGETLCLIEAMKMMSEIPAPADCVVEEILVDDGSAVGYGQPLFRVRRV